jgi:hypothetical protein
MTTDFELLYKPAIHAAEKRFRSLQKSPPDQWIPVNSDTAVEVYSNLERNSSFKAVTEIKSSKKELEYWFSVLSTLYIRPNCKW